MKESSKEKSRKEQDEEDKSEQSNNQDKSNTNTSCIVLESKALWILSQKSLDYASHIIAMAESASSALISTITTTADQSIIENKPLINILYKRAYKIDQEKAKSSLIRKYRICPSNNKLWDSK